MPSHSILVRRDKITARHMGGRKTLIFSVMTSFTHFYNLTSYQHQEVPTENRHARLKPGTGTRSHPET